VKADPDTDFAMKAGRLVIRKQFVYFAVPFFKAAVTREAHPAHDCADGDLLRAVSAAVLLPTSHAMHSEGEAVQRACSAAGRP
jgi:hypothetical protein